jgi:O-antigen/teichoic acid export membrane protein
MGIREASKKNINDNLIASSITLSRLSLSFIVLIFALIILPFILSNNEIREVSTVYLIYLIPFAFLLDWFFVAKQQIKTAAAGKIAGSVIYLLFVLFFVRSSGDTINAAYGFVIGGIFSTSLLMHHFYKLGKRINILKIKDLAGTIRASLPLGSAAVIAELIIIFPVLYIGYAASVSDAGIFSAAFKIIILILAVDRIFNSFFLPKISSYLSNQASEKENIINSILKIIITVSLFILLILIIFSDSIILLIYGSVYAGASLPLKLLSFYFALSIINSVFTYTLVALKKEKYYTISLLLGAAAFLISILFIENPLIASAAGLILFQAVSLIYMFYHLNKFIKIDFFTLLLPFLFTAFISGVFIYFDLSLIIQIILILPFVVILLRAVKFSMREINLIKRSFI